MVVGKATMIPLLMVLFSCTTNQVEAKKLTVSVYYESLCPDSVDFFVKQFYPVYKEGLKDNITVDLVPFGFATAKQESGEWSFECQHGENECYGNKVHSCAIDIASKDLSTEFIACAMSSDNASDDNNLKSCAEKNNINWKDIDSCLTSGKGDKLLAAYGDRTQSVRPNITFIPTIVFNNKKIEQLQNISLVAFKEIATYLLGDGDCSKYKNSGSTVVLSLSLIAFSLVLSVRRML